MQTPQRLARLAALLLVGGAMTSCATTTPPAITHDKEAHECARTAEDIICTAIIDEQTSVVIAYGLERLWTVKLTTLKLPQGAAGTLIERKRAEDHIIYNDTAHHLSAIVSSVHQGDAAAFLVAAAEKEGYQGSFWQRLSATLASARTRGALSAAQWIEADPLIGTAGNGPTFVFKGVPGLDGASPGSWTSRIAAAHDADWSLGRYLNVGPLSTYLAPTDIGGEAPQRYTDTLGLAGLGDVLCNPGAICDWYIFNPSGLGGPYARPFMHHPDWRIIDEDIKRMPTSACIEHKDRQWCWCLSKDTMTADACDAPK